MKYKTINDITLEADSFQGLAVKFWGLMKFPEPTLEEWIEGSARRAKIWNGAEIRTTSPEDHITDLIAAGFLVLVE